MKKSIIYVIRVYQKTLSLDHGVLGKIIPHQPVCVFYPTCSEYTIQAIEKYGLIKGFFKGFQRVLRCHPWQTPAIDKP